MADTSIAQLQEEFAKFTDFSFPDVIRASMNKAVVSIRKREEQTPLLSCESPVFRAAKTIVTNAKLTTMVPTFIPTLLRCIGDGVFGKAPLDQIVVHLTEWAVSIEDAQMKEFLEGSTEIIMRGFPCMDLIRVHLSMILSIALHESEAQRLNALLLFSPVLEAMVKGIRESQECPQSFIETCQVQFKSWFTKFDEPLYFILWLLFNDLSMMTLGQPTVWLCLPKKFFGIYDVLELIVTQHVELLREREQLVSVVAGTVIPAMAEPMAIQFVVAFLDGFLECHESLCREVFMEYISTVSAKGQNGERSLLFFRCLVGWSTDLTLRVYKRLGIESAFVSLVKAMCAVTQGEVPAGPIDLSMYRVGVQVMASEKARMKFVTRAPYEICIGLMRSLYSDEGLDVVYIITNCCAEMTEMVTRAVRFVSEGSFAIACEAIKAMFKFIRRIELTESRVRLLDKMCSLDFQRNPEFHETEKFSRESRTLQYRQFLCEFSEANPDLFSGRWEVLFTALVSSGVMPSESYGVIFTGEQLENIIHVLMAMRPLPIETVLRIVLTNTEKHGVIGEVIRSSFEAAVERQIMDRDLFSLLLATLNHGLRSFNEAVVFDVALKLVAPESPLTIEEKRQFIQELRVALSGDAVEAISAGWPSIFALLNPVNFAGDANGIQSAFGSLNMICNDQFHRIPTDALLACINIILAFAGGDVDINISLSAFDMTWLVVGVIGREHDLWRSLLFGILKLIEDRRSDVSQCASRTLCSLVSSSFEQIPGFVFKSLVDEGFMALMHGLPVDQAEMLPDVSLALQELAHCATSFWVHFARNERFVDECLPLMIQKQNHVLRVTGDKEVIAKGLAFYQIMFQCDALDPKTEGILRDSLIEINDDLLKLSDTVSLVFTQFGHILGQILLSLKRRNVCETLSLWFPIFRAVAKNRSETRFVHSTIQCAFDQLPGLLPMPEDVTFQCVDLLTEFVTDITYVGLQKYSARILSLFWEGALQDEFRARFITSCTIAFDFPESEILMMSVIDFEFPESVRLANGTVSSYSRIYVASPEFRDRVNSSLVRIFTRLSASDQKLFVTCIDSDFSVISLLWKRYFEPGSPAFDQQIYESHFDSAIDRLYEILCAGDMVLPIIRFLGSCSVPARSFNGKETNKWFIVKCMPVLFSLITSPSAEIRDAVQELLMPIGGYLSSLV